jgi:hypothetical protein
MKTIALTDQEITKIIQSCISYREWLRKYIVQAPIGKMAKDELSEVQAIIKRMVALEEQP